jgi:hypothetical protein
MDTSAGACIWPQPVLHDTPEVQALSKVGFMIMRRCAVTFAMQERTSMS